MINEFLWEGNPLTHALFHPLTRKLLEQTGLCLVLAKNKEQEEETMLLFQRIFIVILMIGALRIYDQRAGGFSNKALAFVILLPVILAQISDVPEICHQIISESVGQHAGLDTIEGFKPGL